MTNELLYLRYMPGKEKVDSLSDDFIEISKAKTQKQLFKGQANKSASVQKFSNQ